MKKCAFRRGLPLLSLLASCSPLGAPDIGDTVEEKSVASTAEPLTMVTSPALLVDPFLGTQNAGNTFPGADAPFGMVQFTPVTTEPSTGGGNYSYLSSKLVGFALTALSGPAPDCAGDIPVLPVLDDPTVESAQTVVDTFSHANEYARPGLYRVTSNSGITSQLTVTPRSGMARFTFPAGKKAKLLFRLEKSPTKHGKYIANFQRSLSPVYQNGQIRGVRGYSTTGRFVEFDRPETETTSLDTSQLVYFDYAFEQQVESLRDLGNGNYLVTFVTPSTGVIQAKVGLSYVSEANAELNRSVENSNWNFDSVVGQTQANWNGLLRRIQIGGGTAAQQKVFYTALYHSLLHPNIVSDLNGQYMGFDGRVYTVVSGQSAQYGNISGWDIYHGQAQLEALLAPKIASDTAQSMVNEYRHVGQFPKWSIGSKETYTMVGDPAAPILAGYYAFGARSFDVSLALSGLINQATVANKIRPGLSYYMQYGYLPSDVRDYPADFYGPVATQLEYAISDFSVGALACSLGSSTDCANFTTRAQNWKNVFNRGSGLMQPRSLNGAWTPGDDPDNMGSWFFVEGSSRQYTGSVPFNVRELADAMGGNGKYVDFLDAVTADIQRGHSEGTYLDVTNEIGLGVPWHYDYVGQPWKTQRIIREIQRKIWGSTPQTWYAENDDLGGMSAWYVWSALGMYPLTPGKSDLALGSPMFPRTVITLTTPQGEPKLTIEAPAAADNAPYVQYMAYEGQAWNRAYLPPSAITSGGTLTVGLGTAPNVTWASGADAAPPSYPANPNATVVRPEFPPVAGPIVSWIGGKCIDIEQGSSANGSKVHIRTCSGAASQNITPASNGTLQALGKCLTVKDNGTINNSLIHLWDCDGSRAQVWIPQANHSLYNPQAGRCLDVPESQDVDGTQLQLFDCNQTNAQRWVLTYQPRGPIASGISGKCLDVDHSNTGDGTKVQTWSCNSSGAQTWTMMWDGTIRAFGKCLDVRNSGTADRTQVWLWDCHGGASQQWQYRPDLGLMNPNSGKCLDVPESSTADGTGVQLFTCNGTGAQRWTVP